MKSDLSGALRTTLNVFDAWAIRPADRPILLGCDQPTYDRWVATRELGEYSADALKRISYILGIWKALQVLFPEPHIANSWIHRINTATEFQGQTPLQIMLEDKVAGLAKVRHFLDGWLG